MGVALTFMVKITNYDTQRNQTPQSEWMFDVRCLMLDV